jgi:hypothetical protein
MLVAFAKFRVVNSVSMISRALTSSFLSLVIEDIVGLKIE